MSILKLRVSNVFKLGNKSNFNFPFSFNQLKTVPFPTLNVESLAIYFLFDKIQVSEHLFDDIYFMIVDFYEPKQLLIDPNEHLICLANMFTSSFRCQRFSKYFFIPFLR